MPGEVTDKEKELKINDYSSSCVLYIQPPTADLAEEARDKGTVDYWEPQFRETVYQRAI
jgi:hypothetical protein